MPKKKRCPGSHQRVLGPDEPTGTVYCSVCGDSSLPMETVVVGGVQCFRVPLHYRTPHKLARIKANRSTRRQSRRDSGRR